MNEPGSPKPSIFSHTGLMTVIAAAISALAAVAVAYIQKSGPAEKAAEASASAAPGQAAANAAPVYVTKVINGKTVRVLVPAAQAATGGGAAAQAASGETRPAADGGGAAQENHAAAPADHTPAAAAEPEPDAPADTGDESQ